MYGAKELVFCALLLIFDDVLTVIPKSTKFTRSYINPSHWVTWESSSSSEQSQIYCGLQCSWRDWCNGFQVDMDDCLMSKFSSATGDSKNTSLEKVYSDFGYNSGSKIAFRPNAEGSRDHDILFEHGVCSGSPRVPHLPPEVDVLQGGVITFIEEKAIILLCGGRQQVGGNMVNTCWYYSLLDGGSTWVGGVEQTMASFGSAVASYGNKVYVFEGTYLDVFDGDSLTFTTLKTAANDDFKVPPAQGQSLYACMVAVDEDTLIFTGGLKLSGPLVTYSATYLLNLKAGTLESLPPMNERRNLHGCGIVDFNGHRKIMVAGGVDRDASGSTESYTIEMMDLDTFSPWEYISSPISHQKILAIMNTNHQTEIGFVGVSLIWFLNPTSMTWRELNLDDSDAAFYAAQVPAQYFPDCK